MRTKSVPSPVFAWTEVGGELPTIEAVTAPGKGTGRATTAPRRITESIQVALSSPRRAPSSVRHRRRCSEKKEIHIHVPEGATWPSAGVAMVTAIVSTPTLRKDVAMTGEVSAVRSLPIGGLKEKLVLARLRAAASPMSSSLKA
jgi:ATP-dependent Lon protease